jgi:hypothetical protein
MRLVLAVVVGALGAAVGAVILAEYQLAGAVGLIAGSLFGLAVAELVVTVGGDAVQKQPLIPAIAVALFTAVGVIYSARQFAYAWSYVPVGAWLGALAGAILGPWWLTGAGRRGSRTTSA